MRTRRYITYLSAVFIVFLISFGGIYYLIIFNPASSSRPLQPASPVEVMPLKKQVLRDHLEAVANVLAYESVTISANVTEYVKKLYFEDGDKVKKGDLLVELETAEEKAQLLEAKAKLYEAKQHFNRIENLLKRNFSAQAEYDAQKANVESAKAKLMQIKATIADRKIKAPFDGILGFRLISEGTLIEAGDDIVTLDMLHPLRIDFTVPERFLKQIKQGMPFTATSIAYPNHIFQGTLKTVNPRVDQQTRAVTLRGIIANQDLKLKPGMLLHINLPLAKKTVWSIPEQALLAREKKRYIFIVPKGQSKAQRIEVTLVGRSRDQVFIQGKLDDTFQVVSKGGFKLKHNQEVLIQNVAK